MPYLDFAPLDNAVAHLKRAAHDYDEAYEAASSKGLALSVTQRAQVDTVLQGLEQVLTAQEGLPGRPWYKHLVYAPGVYTGYGAKTLPGVREAIEDHRWDECSRYIQITAQALQNYSLRLEAAATLLRG